MKHFFLVNHDGEIFGAARMDGGFPGEQDLSDPTNQHPVTIAHRKLAADDKQFSHYVGYECPCSPEVKTCSCISEQRNILYVNDGGHLVSKPALTVLVDGVAAPLAYPPDPITNTPMTQVKVRLVAPDIPDGHQVTAMGRGPASIIAKDTTLTFYGGQTPEITLITPAHGMLGWVFGKSKLVRPFRVQLKGWG